jgi:hypothetical protein
VVKVDGHERFSRDQSIDQLGEALKGIRRDHILLQALGKSLRVFRQAGIPVVTYLGPINIEYLRSLNVVDEELLQASIQAYRDVAHDYGASFLDFHDILPDTAFYDAASHFRPTPSIDPNARIIDGIHPFLVAELERITQRAEGSPPGINSQGEF